VARARAGARAIEKVTAGGTLSILAGTGQTGPPVPGPASSSTLNNPAGVVADSAGNVYIADQNNHAIEKVALDGTLSVYAGIPGVTGLPTAGPAASSHLNNPDAIAIDSADNVYIADYGNAVIEKVTPAGQLSVIAGIPGSAGTPTAGPATSSHLSQANGVAVDSAGNVYIADGGPNGSRRSPLAARSRSSPGSRGHPPSPPRAWPPPPRSAIPMASVSTLWAPCTSLTTWPT